MREQDMIEILRRDVEIPAVVQERAEGAFAQIRQEQQEEMSRGRQCGIDPGREPDGYVERQDAAQRAPSRRSRGTGRKKRILLLAVAAATLAFAGITAVGAGLRWRKSLSEGMQASEEQMVQLEESHAVSFSGQTCTDQGITVSAAQSITDRYFAQIAFKVEGYTPQEGKQPHFGRVQVTVGDGETVSNMGHSFYDGLVVGPDGMPMYADGQPVDLEKEGDFGRYVQEDGSLEYRIFLMSEEEGAFLDQPIHVELYGIGTVHKAEYHEEIQGRWVFDWNLQGTDAMRECVLNAALGDTGATVTRAEISPISLHVEYRFPMQKVKEEAVTEDGQTVYTEMLAEPPALMGVKMKDGTLYPYLTNGGSMGYAPEDPERYIVTFATDRILDVGQVESLLFLRGWSGVAGEMPEEAFYVVPLE